MRGSQLYSREEPCHKPPCQWKGLWMHSRLITHHKDIKLEYDQASNTYHNQSGIGIKAVGFGVTCRVEYLFASGNEKECGPRIKRSEYLHHFVEYFVKNFGYERDRTIRAAPYDFRMTPEHHEQRGYYSSLKKLVEEMYEDGGNTKVTLVVHSMGAPVTLYFLNNVVDQDWKDTYIHAFVPLAGAWSGGNAVLRSLISGMTLKELIPVDLSGTPDHVSRGGRTQVIENSFRGLLDQVPKLTKDVVRTLPGVLLMLPNATVWKDKVLVKTDSRDYTASDYEALFTDADYPLGFTMYSNGITGINAGYPAPNVPVYCFYGTGIPTEESFYYNNGFEESPIITTGPGDGTVNDLSSEVCLEWAGGAQQQHFESRNFEGVHHNKIVTHPEVLEAVKDIVTSI
eukprot:Em0017g626a